MIVDLDAPICDACKRDEHDPVRPPKGTIEVACPCLCHHYMDGPTARKLFQDLFAAVEKKLHGKETIQ
jgi:hypothetical protein